MRILMKHADEGEKFVYLDDIESHRADGWVNANEFVPPEESKDSSNDQPKKRGRPAKDR